MKKICCGISQSTDNRYPDCRLSETRRHVLIGEGNPDARLLLVALSPGEKEDRNSSMFIGPSGEILNTLNCVFFQQIVNGIRSAP